MRLDDRLGRDPVRVVVDSQARTPPSASVIASSRTAPCIIATTETAPRERIAALEKAGAAVWLLPQDPFGRVDLLALASKMAEEGIVHALVEAGPRLQAAFIQAGLTDRLIVIYAPKTFADPQALSMLAGAPLWQIENAHRWRVIRHYQVGDDIVVELERSLRQVPCQPAE